MIARVCVIAPLWAAIALAQPAPHFEIASIRPSAPGSDLKMLSLSGGFLNVQAMPLRMMILYAFGSVQSWEFAGIPASASSDRYDITARAAGQAAADKMYPMLIPLLQDRFKMQYHREKRQLPVYNLTVIKAGKLPPPNPANCRGTDPRLPPPQPQPGKRMVAACGSTLMPILPASGAEIYGGSITMAALAGRLTDTLDRRVVDQTGFTAKFDLDLKFAIDDAVPELARYAATPGQASDPSGYPNIFTALREQLGLKLEAAKGPVEVIVIDHIEKPSAN